jgi:zinc D-Ala-D-Ala carboxypeptidase|tara:strand:- start:1441 stop:1788 length:348 start_codon:yes stop_codon:yes gene_type:complete
MTFRYFTRKEFDCQQTGENEMQDEFIHSLDALRHECGFSFRITSGYRSPSHSIEARKATPGTHAQGIAADIGTTDGSERYIIVKNAMAMGFSGIGIHKTFVHVDTRTTTPVVWTY